MEHGQVFEAQTKNETHLQLVKGLQAVDLELTEDQKQKIELLEGDE